MPSMPNELEGQTLIDGFFAALKLRDLDQCETVLTRLQALAREQARYRPWRIYLSGILVSERDHDWVQAERIFNSVLQADPEPALEGRALMALGNVCKYQGGWQRAVRAYKDALALFEQLNRPIDQVKSWKQIAIAYRRGYTRGDFPPEVLEQAVAHCRMALDVLESTPDPALDWLKGSVWNTLGLLHRDLGDWDEAIACYQRDLSICRALDDRFGMGLSYGNLGEVYQRRGQETCSKALQSYQNALTIIREFDDRYEEVEALANLGFLYQEMDRHEEALDCYEQALGLIERLRAGLSSETGRAGFFATVSETYAHAILLGLKMGRVRWAFDLVERARARAFLDILAARSLDLARRMEAPTRSLDDVQAALPADGALIEYFATGLIESVDRSHARHTDTRRPERHRFPPSKTLIFAVTRDRIEVHDAQISPNDLRPHWLDNVVECHFLAPRIRRVLYDKLVEPVAHLFRDMRKIYLAPHGPLHYVPFQALLASDGQLLLCDEGPQLIYAPSATVLLSGESRGASSARGSCLAIGYNSDGEAQLRFAEEEARRVAQQTGGETLLGQSPKKETVFNQAANYRLLHISCHGEFSPADPLSSFLRLAPDETLTAMEVLHNLNLQSDLATLSACESGLSRVRRGDELIGFMRAFLYAGASALLVTLWRADERSTLILMERFYQEIQAGVEFAEALRRAQCYLRNLTRFSDPYYWAPFILIESSIS